MTRLDPGHDIFNGWFGDFGGRYVPETLIGALDLHGLKRCIPHHSTKR